MLGDMKMKKFTKALILSLAIVGTLSTSVMAAGTWNAGVNKYSSGWYMGYSYYQSDAYHGSYAALDGKTHDGWIYASAGQNSLSNSASVPSYTTATLSKYN